MKYIDVHAHLNEPKYYGCLDEVMEGCRANMKTIISSGYDYPSSLLARDISYKGEGLYFTAGIHPEHAPELDDDMLTKIADLSKDKKCVAIGEIGLDYHYDGYDWEVEKVTFLRQLELAHDLGMPVVVHSRDCSGDMMAFLKEHRDLLDGRFLLHCYSESLESAKEYEKLGAYFSFGGVITFKNAKKEEIIRAISPERLLSETDAPYLSPEPFRGQMNTPARVGYVVRKMADILGRPEEEMVRIIEENTYRLFGV